MATNFNIIQQLMQAGKLPNSLPMSGPVTGSAEQQPPVAPQPDPMMQPPVVPPAGQPPTQMPFEAPMQPQMNQPQVDPLRGINETQKGLNAAFNRQEQAVQKAAALGQQKAAEETAFQIEQDKRIKEYEAQQQQAEQDRQAKTQEAMTKLSQIQQEYAGMKIDPSRYWASRSTNGKILTAIGLIFGSAGSGASNKAADVLQNAINQDIELQKLDIDKKGNELTQQKGMLAEMRQQFGDVRAAEQATKALMLEAAQRQMQIIGGRYRGEEQAAALEQAMGQLEAEKQKAIGDFYKTVDDINYRRSSLGLERERLDLQRIGLAAEMAKGDEKDVSNRIVTVREGVNEDGSIKYGERLARDPEAAKKAREIYGATEELMALIDEAKAFRQEKGRAWQPRAMGIIGGGAEAADAQRITTQITLKLKSLEAMGALDAGVLKIGEMLAKNPGSITSSDASILNTYENFRKAIMRSTNASLRQYGDDIRITDPARDVQNRLDIRPR